MAANTISLNDKTIRIFMTDVKTSNREPDMSGKFRLQDTIYHCALWSNTSRRTGQKFYKGLLHKDGERGKNVGTLNLHCNKWYIENTDSKLPFYYGRLKVNYNEYKISLWIKTRESKKPFYSGVIKLI